MGETNTPDTQATDTNSTRTAPPMPAGDLPEAVTVFVTHAERTLILRALRAIHPDRSVALQRALGVDTTGGGA